MYFCIFSQLPTVVSGPGTLPHYQLGDLGLIPRPKQTIPTSLDKMRVLSATTRLGGLRKVLCRSVGIQTVSAPKVKSILVLFLTICRPETRTKIFLYCTCPAGQVTYNFYLSCKRMHLSFKGVCNKEHKGVICNMTSLSNSSQSTHPTGRVLLERITCPF